MRQRNLAEWLGRLSPVCSFTALAERIAATHPSVGEEFAGQARRFHDGLVDLARRQDGLGLRFFTPLNLSDFLPLSEYQAVLRSHGTERLEQMNRDAEAQATPLQKLPAFRFRPTTPFAALAHVDLLLLAVLPAVMLSWGHLGFARREEGGRP